VTDAGDLEDIILAEDGLLQQHHEPHRAGLDRRVSLLPADRLEI
jgi:hypothetical protein